MRIKANIRIVIASLLLLSGTASGSRAVAAPDIRNFDFSHIGPREGLKGQHVFSICQTHDGAVWWATKNTVDRYNGQTVKNYWLDKNAPYDYVSGRTISLVTDKEGCLYAFDNKGKIFKYNPLRDQFILHADMRKLLGREIMLNHIHIDGEGIWTGIHDGAYLLKDNRLSEIVSKHFVHHILEAGNAHLVCTDNGIYAASSESVTLVSPIDAESGYYDPQSRRIWLGTFSGGVCILDNDNLSAPPSTVQNLPNNPVRSIIRYDEDAILVGVDGFGVFSVPSAAGEKPSATLLFDANKGEQGVLHGNGVYSLVRDNWGDIFIGTYSGGVDIARRSDRSVKIFSYDREAPETLGNNHVNCVAQLPDGRLMMGTDDGVSILNPATGTWTQAAKGLIVLSICRTDGNEIILGTFGKGVFRIDRNGKVSLLYSKAGGQLMDDHIYSIIHDKAGHLWIGCLNGDLVERSIDGKTNFYPIRNVQDIIQLEDGRIAVATASGVFLPSPGGKEPQELEFSPSGASEGVNRYILQMHQEGNKLWLASDGGGIYIVDLHGGSCKQLTTADGLPSNVISSIGRDNSGKMWIASDCGLGYVQNDGKGVLVNYISSLGKEYIPRAMTLLKDGRMLLGTTEGAILMEPGMTGQANYQAPLRITGVSFKAKGDEESEAAARRLIDHKALDLSYSQNTFEVFAESVNMHYGGDIAYQYQMDNGGWSQASPQGIFRFVEVEPGEHTLEIRSVSIGGQIILDSDSISVTVGLPWWKTWWMNTVYFLIILSAFIGAWKIYGLHNRYMRLVLNNSELQNSSTPEQEEYAGPKDGNGKEFVDSITRVVVENMSDSGFSIDALCREMGMSRTYLYVRLKTFTGQSPQDFIRVIRMEKAAVLLRSGLSVTEVAEAVGMENPKYFSTVFKKYFEVSPSKFH